MPGFYATEEIPSQKKIIHQRYQIKEIGFYWLIAELDPKRETAFGYANLNDDMLAEWAYISIDELHENGAGLDREWKPCTYKDALKRIREERGEQHQQRG